MMSSNTNRNRGRSLQAMPRDHLSWRVIDFLDANRGEMLTRRDVATKFEVDAVQVDALLAPAVAAGMLQREDHRAEGLVWRRPRKLGNLPMPFTPALSAAMRKMRAAKVAAQRVDLEAIVIEHDVPICEPRQPVGSLWNALFDRMAPGDSFALPNRNAVALNHAKLKYCKRTASARFVTRKVDGDTTRIWRTA
jgi:hypothetical protein